MSNISRRDFLKTAGVMTLAVAAAGVLAGCDNNNNGGGEIIPTSASSATVGDFTVSIEKTVLLAFAEYNPDQSIKEAHQRALVAVKVKRNKDLGMINNLFHFGIVAKNVTEVEEAGQLLLAPIADAKIAKAIGMDVAPVKPADSKMIKEVAGVYSPVADQPMSDEETVYFEYEVTGNAATGKFMTPVFDLYVMDEEKVNRVKLTKSFPAATTVNYKNDLGLANA